MSAHTEATPSAEQVRIPDGHIWGKLPILALAVGVIGLGATFALGMGDKPQLYHSYLTAFLFCLTIGLGALVFTVIQFAARAGWSVVVRRTAEHLMAPLPVLLLLFIPVAIGAHDLYHWTHADAVAGDPILKWKEPFLNEGFWRFRALFYFVMWTGLVMWYRKTSIDQDATGGVGPTRRMQNFSGPAIILFALTATGASIDWAMSLDPHWFSTMWGVYFFAGGFMACFATLAVLHLGMEKTGLLKGIVNVEHYHDLGKLLFAFTVFWTYIAFSQYFLIWYSNIPEETSYFAHRMGNSWEQVGIAIMVGHFGLPFLFLMPRTIKRNRLTLLLGALWMLALHYVDLYYVVMPNLHKAGVHFSPLDVTALLGVGGIFFGVVLMMQKRAALIPVKDPRLSASLAFENF